VTPGGFSESRLGRIREAMGGYVERGEVPGVVTLVSRRGEVHVEALGRRRVGGDPVRRDTIFRISSMTKPIMAAATMILVEECKLRLDEPVNRLLPELADRRVLKRVDGPLDETVPARRPIRVADLLTFTMGFGIAISERPSPIEMAADELRLGQGIPSPSTPPGPDEWIGRLGTLPLMCQPGEAWIYNTGSDVQGVLVARAAGRPLESFLTERIFGPLGMKDTGFSVPASKQDRFVDQYRTNFRTGQVEVYDPAETGQWSRPPDFPSGAGGLVSTVDDYLAFSETMLNGGRSSGGERILSRPSVEMMTTDRLTPPQKAAALSLVPGFFEGHGWGLGMSVATARDGVLPAGTFGWSGGLGSLWNCDPREGMTTILMTQRAWNSPRPPNICLDFLESAYQAIDD